MRYLVPALLFFAFALPGCAEQQWRKTGASEAAVAQDLSACNKQARASAVRMGHTGLPPTSDPRFGAPSGPSQADQLMLERQAADACMREKGYALVPVGK
jgi:hypothetical protein